MPFGSVGSFLPGEDDWFRQIMGGGMRTPPIFGGVGGSPEMPGVPLPTPSAAPERPNFLSKLDKIGGALPLGLALLANSGNTSSFGEAFGRSALQANQMGAENQQQKLKDEYTRAQIKALTSPRQEATPNSIQEYEYAKQQGDKRSYAEWRQASTASGGPTADIQNFEYWNKLTDDQKKKFMGLQRQPTVPQIVDINGVKTLVDRLNNTQTPLTTLDAEADAQRRLKGAEAEGAAFGKASGEISGAILKKGSDAKAVTNILDSADALIDVATGSMAGAARDKVAAAFGYAPSSAQAIGELKILQANLMLQQPRMEGPQGVLDVQLYEKMAGEIGDPTVPAAIKKANLRRIRELQQKNVERAVDAGTPPGGAASKSKRVRVDAQGNVLGN